jgi:hypothetical protein
MGESTQLSSEQRDGLAVIGRLKAAQGLDKSLSQSHTYGKVGQRLRDDVFRQRKRRLAGMDHRELFQFKIFNRYMHGF